MEGDKVVIRFTMKRYTNATVHGYACNRKIHKGDCHEHL